jgi:hypothetical protein
LGFGGNNATLVFRRLDACFLLPRPACGETQAGWRMVTLQQSRTG